MENLAASADAPYDALIVGAGPAGSTAGRLLAAAGLKVALLDKARFPRSKTCGGGLILRSLARLPPAAAATVERACFEAEMNFLASGLSFHVRRKQPVVAMAMRDRFDHALVQAAVASGAQLCEECPVESVVQNAEGVQLRTPRGVFSGRFAIAADGALGRMAALAGFLDGRLLIPALEAEVHVAAPILASFGQRARFDFELVPDGYAWVFPKADHLSIGVLAAAPGEARLQQRLEEYLRRLDIVPLRIEKHGYVIPVRPRRPPYAKGRVLLAGDALGLADALTAEGISSALRSGEVAAHAILDGGGAARRVARLYQRGLRRELLRELAWSRRLAHILYFKPRLRAFLFRRCGQQLCEVLTDCLLGEERLPQALLNPRRWIKLLASLTARVPGGS